MKRYMNLFPLIAICMILCSCVDDAVLPFDVKKPESLAQYEYLNTYDVLKSYINRTKYPNFKLGTGVSAGDFNSKGVVYELVTTNFDEMTAGNEMKYASCVADDGTMNFSTVESFVQTAKAAGITIYGHTLAWHAQQNNKYLNSLIADKKLDIDPNATVEKQDALVDYSTYTKFPFYVMGYEPQMIDGQLVSSNPDGAWIQYFVADGIPTTKGGDYKVTALIQGSANGALDVQMGDWSANIKASLGFTTDWKEVSVVLSGVPATSSFVIFQPGTFKGDIRIKWLKVTHSEAPVNSWWENLVQNSDCEGNDVSSFFITDKTGGPKPATFGAEGTGAGGTGRAIVVQSIDNPPNAWATQFFVKVNHTFAANEKIRFSMKVKADKNATIESQAHNNPGGYLYYAFVGSPNITTEWKDYTFTGSVPTQAAGANTIAFNLNVSTVATTYYFDDIKWEIEQVSAGIPLTPEEKKDTLTFAMGNWIKGMMNACGGYVIAWDAVNEALSGVDKDGDGVYDLQSATRNTVSANDAKNNFYWQDYLGDIDYIRIVIKLARQYFAESGGNPSNLKLFINDYNLESDWDNNGKMKSMLKWIERWEADGVTKIDGIGTQMHISCYMDPATQKSKEEHIQEMFRLLASSGKLVKITELDMGLVDAAGVDVKTENITFEQEQAMAAFYKFIVQNYLEIIPVAQQYGITHWSPTDSPVGSGWRADSPIGLWNLDYNRKPAYAGFADGLSGK